MEEYIKTILTEEDQAWLSSTYDKLLVKMKRECERVGTMIPYSPRDGKYHDLDFGTTGKEAEKDGKSPLLCYWTNGFWPGMLWQMYQTTGDEAYRTTAEGVEARIMSNLVQIDLAGHDIGFVLLPSAVANYRKTGNLESRKNALIAAQTLAGRYNSAGRYIRAWNDSEMMEKMMGGGVPLSGWMIIDCLMNIPMLFWASETTKDPRYAQVALNHAKTAQQYIARGDGSSNHIVRFDPATGEFVDAPGGQGYGVGSAWSRGQGRNGTGTAYDLCGLYLQVLDDLWQKDPALNEDIAQAALDLSQAPGDLTEGEKAALVWRFGELHGVDAFAATFEELKEQGYIRSEPLGEGAPEGGVKGFFKSKKHK